MRKPGVSEKPQQATDEQAAAGAQAKKLRGLARPVATCQVGDHLDHAVKLMWEQDCDSVPILDENGRVIAVLTDHDICMAAYRLGKPLAEINVRTAMSPGVCACISENSLEQVEMAETQID